MQIANGFNLIIPAFLAFSFISYGQSFQGPLPTMEFAAIPQSIFEYNRFETKGGSVILRGDSVSVDSFQIMTTEVTQGMWETVTGTKVYRYLHSRHVRDIGPDFPMTAVSLGDCGAFADSLSAMDSLYTYSIPPDAYWTFAASAGSYAPYFWGEDTLDIMQEYCWYSENSGGRLQRTATLAPNQWGLYDMLGNAWEWTTVLGGVRDADPNTGEETEYQIVRGGSVYSAAEYCSRGSWASLDSAAIHRDVGFRLMRVPDEPEPVEIPYGQLLDSLLQDRRFAVYIEPVLAVGGISHDFNSDDIQQFGYDVKNGCEQNAAYLRLGIGKHWGDFGIFAYGEAGSISPGWLIDNHGPWILPEVHLRITTLGGGLELRYRIVRCRIGCSQYGGEATVDLDTTGAVSPGSWTTDIENGSGMNYALGVHLPIDENWSAGAEWSQHFIDLRLGRSGTGIPPSDHRAVQSEIRFFANYQLPFELGGIL